MRIAYCVLRIGIFRIAYCYAAVECDVFGIAYCVWHIPYERHASDAKCGRHASDAKCGRHASDAKCGAHSKPPTDLATLAWRPHQMGKLRGAH